MEILESAPPESNTLESQTPGTESPESETRMTEPVAEQQRELGDPQFSFALPTTDDYDDFCWFDQAFSAQDVERILAIGETAPMIAGSVGPNPGVNREIRDSEIRWIGPDSESIWLFERITELVQGCNRARYGFDLAGIYENLQITQYGAGGFYNWHKDHGKRAHSIRKLSVTIQLSDPSEYDGGDLEFLAGPQVQTAPRGLGTAVVFPSFVMHRVTPVTRGLRRSIVAWISGPPYR